MLDYLLCPSEETLKRIGRLEETCAAIDRDMALMGPLAAHLLPMKRQMDMDAEPREGRVTSLERGEWKKQYEAGVNRCMGFDILWT
ncbi:hypothetical protein [Litorivivens sp.]|uniref:hypothetical protein n=1 Tax=Litorivivens sp. TaxID=2020868 RepID=UPI0035658A80